MDAANCLNGGGEKNEKMELTFQVYGRFILDRYKPDNV